MTHPASPRPSAESVGRIIDNIASARPDGEIVFAWNADVTLSYVRRGPNTWQISTVDQDGLWVRCVGIVPGTAKAYEVRRYWGDVVPVTVTETRGIEAAISAAIDTLTETE